MSRINGTDRTSELRRERSERRKSWLFGGGKKKEGDSGGTEEEPQSPTSSSPPEDSSSRRSSRRTGSTVRSPRDTSTLSPESSPSLHQRSKSQRNFRPREATGPPAPTEYESRRERRERERMRATTSAGTRSETRLRDSGDSGSSIESSSTGAANESSSTTTTEQNNDEEISDVEKRRRAREERRRKRLGLDSPPRTTVTSPREDERKKEEERKRREEDERKKRDEERRKKEEEEERKKKEEEKRRAEEEKKLQDEIERKKKEEEQKIEEEPKKNEVGEVNNTSNDGDDKLRRERNREERQRFRLAEAGKGLSQKSTLRNELERERERVLREQERERLIKEQEQRLREKEKEKEKSSNSGIFSRIKSDKEKKKEKKLREKEEKKQKKLQQKEDKQRRRKGSEIGSPGLDRKDPDSPRSTEGSTSTPTTPTITTTPAEGQDANAEARPKPKSILVAKDGEDAKKLRRQVSNKRVLMQRQASVKRVGGRGANAAGDDAAKVMRRTISRKRMVAGEGSAAAGALGGGARGGDRNTEAKRAQFRQQFSLYGISVTHIKQRHGLQFVSGFNPLPPPRAGGKGGEAAAGSSAAANKSSLLLDPKRQLTRPPSQSSMTIGRLAGRLLNEPPPGHVAPDNKNFTKAMVARPAGLERTISFINRAKMQRSVGQQLIPAHKQGMLESMKANRFWFSTINFQKDREESVRKSSVDSVESQLTMKWDDFMKSLPSVQHHYKTVREDLDEKGVKDLEDRGAKIVSALKFLGSNKGEGEKKDGSEVAATPAPTSSDASTEDKKEEKQKEPEDEYSDLKAVVHKVVVPSYLKGFTGLEYIEEEKKKTMGESRQKKYAIDFITHANPNIAEDAQYDMLFGECAAEEPGIYIWRMEYFMPLEIPKKEYPHVKKPDAEDSSDDELEERGGVPLIEWRKVDKKKVSPAVFYSEDCYLILHITARDRSKKFTIFTWLGKKATLDKRGSCALRSRELNIFLNNKAAMRREEEGRESRRFKRILGNVQVRETGGTESAFKPAMPFHQEPRMYRLHFQPPINASSVAAAAGKRNLGMFTMTQVRPSIYSLNKSDVFVLDGGSDGWVFQWNGSKADLRLIYKGHEVVTRIANYERSCRSRIRVVEEGRELEECEQYKATYVEARTKQKQEKEKLLSEAKARKEKAAAFIDVVEESEYRQEADLVITSFFDYLREKTMEESMPEKGPEVIDINLLCRTKIDPETGKPALDNIRSNTDTSIPLSKTMLLTDSCCVLDADTELYVWIGRKSTPIERQVAKAVARKFRSNPARDRPTWTPISIAYEGAEPVAFISKFPDWVAQLFAPLPSNFAAALMRTDRIAPDFAQPDLKVENLLAPPVIPEESMVDDCQGKVEVWAINDGKPTFTKLSTNERGHFYTGDCYLILYTYHNKEDNMKQAYICYFWEGRSSSPHWWPAFLFGFYPVLEKKIQASGGRPPLKIRIQEHKEPAHFLQLFGGMLIIHEGKRTKKNMPTLRTKPLEKRKEFFHVRRTQAGKTHAIEVAATTKSLNSLDSFVLRTPEKIFVWYGKGTKYEDSNVVEKVYEMLQGERQLEVFEEGNEVLDFWNVLGGFTEWECNEKWIKKYSSRPRLYEFSHSAGVFGWTEIVDFWQTDLLPTNVYLMDTFYEVYVWLGKTASESLYKKVLEFANAYIREMAKKRRMFVQLHSIQSGEEPSDFIRHFHTWEMKEPFLDPILKREEKYADLLFQEYKQFEKEEKANKAKLKRERARLYMEYGPLLSIDWVEVIRRELPELVVDPGASDSDEFYDSGDDVEEILDAEEEDIYMSGDEYVGSDGEEEWVDGDDLLEEDITLSDDEL
ncbi:Advillin [Balamuthia mandrillaris]